MICTDSTPPFSPQLLLATYAQGIFPMADPDGNIGWYSPDPRAVFPMDVMEPNARFRRFLRKSDLSCTIDQEFESVIGQCATVHGESWISSQIIEAYSALHHMGHAHSVETWKGDQLVGGLYGVSLGAAFFGESMFSLISNASKAAFYHLLKHLKEQGFVLFDTQFPNDHTVSLGAIEVPRREFRTMLAQALRSPSLF
ncbi:MAG: leucyl/phenylalanyl-tRNA--protein transferase [Flavobacteriales bacterium]|nr:leucyl/phenylalanyl-tRNA--protein transferase [Flavobacteriales bacterium]MCB0759688.1 leucyl/phenylalanyl-tRNA--protein transferase [Flavobacteriales bacterium]